MEKPEEKIHEFSVGLSNEIAKAMPDAALVVLRVARLVPRCFVQVGIVSSRVFCCLLLLRKLVNDASLFACLEHLLPVRLCSFVANVPV